MTTFYDKYVQKYALSRTLRFSLIPLGHTRAHLEKQNILLSDARKNEAYIEIKPLFDTLHAQFIEESLTSEGAENIDVTEYLQEFRSPTRDAKKLENIEKKLRKDIGTLFEQTGNKWKNTIESKNTSDKKIFTGSGYKILLESSILKILQDIFPEKKELINEFNGFFTYFSGFNQNRENYYTTEGKSTEIAFRIVDQNLPKFCNNIITFQKNTEQYLAAYDKMSSKTPQIKNPKTGEIKKISPITEDIFNISFFARCLSQAQIEEYNALIGEYNELINLYNQHISEKSERLRSFLPLYKQIGIKREERFEIFGFKNTEELIQFLEKQYFPTVHQKNQQLENLLASLKTKSEEELAKIYLSKSAINTLSGKFFASWMTLAEQLVQAKIWKKDTEGLVKIPEYSSLRDIFEALNHIEKDALFKTGEIIDTTDSIGEYEKIWKNSTKRNSEIFLEIFLYEAQKAQRNTEKFQKELEVILPFFDKNNETHRSLLKQYADESRIGVILSKYFIAKKIEQSGVDSDFYTPLQNILEEYEIFSWYDALRNFITKKADTTDKMKLNFENATLAAGWDVNKESDNSCVLLLDEKQNSYLAIMSKGHNKVFAKEIGKGKDKQPNSLYHSDNDNWKKIEYKLLPGPNKMLPKCLLPKSDRKKYGATDEILQIYDSGAFKKSEPSFDIKKLHILIDFYKEALKKYEDWKVFDFAFADTESYEDISAFYHDVEKQGYRLDTRDINKEKLFELVDEGKIFLFQIYNRDFSPSLQETSTPNLHTLYWKSVFSDASNKVKLNGEAEIFYRKAYEVEYKKDENGDDIIKNGKKIQNHKRFSEEKFLFHVPVTLNFACNDTAINAEIQESIATEKNINYIGIDRGEKHLLFYSVVDAHGNILEQGSLNEIFEGQNYNEKLSKIAKDRDEARKSWQKIGTIKEMKEGYISQAVKKIADLALKYNAIIVMEDLNTGFKRSRQKIEKQIYQKFELALAKKLNFFVLKNANSGAIGSVEKAYQLTYPVSTYGDIEGRKQVGNIFFTRANYTSQIDPSTGWRKTIYIKSGANNIESCVLENFQDIIYKNNDYIFSYTDKNGKLWEMHTNYQGKNLERFRGKRDIKTGKWNIETVNVHTLFQEIFEDFDHNTSFLSQMKSGKKIKNWESLRFALEMLQQIRNTGKSEHERNSDFLLSPVVNSQNKQFDSREYLDSINLNELRTARVTFPTSGDANGAYNIARKGIIMAEHIKSWIETGKKKDDLSLYISEVEWDLWLHDRDKWKAQIDTFSSKKLFQKKK